MTHKNIEHSQGWTLFVDRLGHYLTKGGSLHMRYWLVVTTIYHIEYN
jgi:hypothetical protein